MSNCNFRCKIVEFKCSRGGTNLYISSKADCEKEAMGQYEDKTLGPL